VNIEGAWSRIEDNHIFLHLTNTQDRGFQDFLDEDSLLRMDHLVITFFELPVYIDILYIQAGEMLKNFIVRPSLNILCNC
jgi:hypothetical protein